MDNVLLCTQSLPYEGPSIFYIAKPALAFTILLLFRLLLVISNVVIIFCAFLKFKVLKYLKFLKFLHVLVE